MAKMIVRMWYSDEDNTIDGVRLDASSDMYYRDVEISVEMGKHMGKSELHRAYAAFLKALGYSTLDIDELID